MVAELHAYRFNAMLNDSYGGRKAIRQCIPNGKLVDIRVSKSHRQEFKRQEIPPRKQRRTGAKKAQERAKYYSRMAVHLVETGVSAVSSEMVKRRRILAIMQKRQEEFQATGHSDYSTHLWSQLHLRSAGANLPEVHWPREAQNTDKGKGGKSKGKVPEPSWTSWWQDTSSSGYGWRGTSSSSSGWWSGRG